MGGGRWDDDRDRLFAHDGDDVIDDVTGGRNFLGDTNDGILVRDSIGKVGKWPSNDHCAHNRIGSSVVSLCEKAKYIQGVQIKFLSTKKT